MERKAHIDAFGAAMLLITSALFGVNQALVKLVNAGMEPVFQAGLRSACAVFPLLLFALWRGGKLNMPEGFFRPALLCGILFASEFWLLFNALEYTSVSRAGLLFYTMPVWVAVAANWLIPDDRLTVNKIIGLLLAVAGVALALLRNDAPATDRAFIGDLMSLTGSLLWAGIALTARLTNFSKASPEMQMIAQLAVSAPILLGLAFFGAAGGGDLFREMTMMLWGVFAFQVIVVVAFGFALWFWVLSIYPASKMASFAFLTPIFSVFFGWLVFDEQLTVSLAIAILLVGSGIYLVNKR